MRFLSFLVVSAVFLSACSNSPEEVFLQGASMGTTWSVKLIEDPDLRQIIEAHQIQAQLDGVEEAMSNWISESDVSRFNTMSSGCTLISSETESVARMAEEISIKSRGYFDVTISPLIELWGFGVSDEAPVEPNLDTLLKVLDETGYKKMSVVERQLCKSQDQLQVNYSAIAKGYAVDQVAQLLSDSGYTRYLVEVGGELYGRGTNAQGNIWKVGIEKPELGLAHGIQATLLLDNLAVATSGDYRNYYEMDSVHYSHIIQPKTGRPVIHSAASVTVIHPSSMFADGWATALLAAGPEVGLELAEENQLAMLMILRAEQQGYSELKSTAWLRYTDSHIESTEISH